MNDPHQPLAMPLQLILHPTDFSEQAQAAFHVACTLGRDYAARVIVLHVAPSALTVLGGMEAVPMLPEEYDTSSLEERVRAMRSPHASVQLEPRVMEGDAVASILQVAKDCGCNLIVMGTHGRTGLSRLLMGSVAEQVVRKATCPVITVKTPLPEK
jgi:nucleotide-binding universal stress UspA family protein